MGKKDEDEIPLLEASEISERRSRVRKTPKLETVETIRYKVQADETLESIALRFAVSKEELKRLNNLFTDSDLITKKEILIPDRRLTAVPTDLLVNIEDQIQDSETSSSIGDATAATDAIFDRIDKSNQEAVHKVSSIGIRHPLTEAENDDFKTPRRYYARALLFPNNEVMVVGGDGPRKFTKFTFNDDFTSIEGEDLDHLPQTDDYDDPFAILVPDGFCML
ncbi:Oidioi.mRNA.OKI2018_I69.chr1.g3639.t1.cds [Oikopleura dioica]|uniref:Oidioi.mRNA.OKI2018_I69.chr1.g3639.t1.cds n=1 Tax=Oikopleura dioica TaxID=34765 RepID=A0ABN7SWJ8_OIKDI|nr:Oidioi.mRNA.OKI2018_I69.chr1.g3639.t1.cds [Oikopleura dioica]